MAGRVIRVVPKTFVTFTTGVNSTNQQTFFLARRVDISQWREVTLYVRTHTPTVIGTGMSTQPTIQVYADGYTNEDPSPATTTAAGPPGFMTALTLTGTVAFAQQANTAIQMLVIPVPANAGGLISIAITAKQAASIQTADIYISIDLSGKE